MSDTNSQRTIESKELRGPILRWAYEQALESGDVRHAAFLDSKLAAAVGVEGPRFRSALASLKVSGLMVRETAFLGGGELLRIAEAGFRAVEHEMESRQMALFRDALKVMHETTRKGRPAPFNTVGGPHWFSAGDIANELGIDRADAGDAMAVLESRGYARRQEGPATYGADAPVVFAITPQGIDFLTSPQRSERGAGDMHVHIQDDFYGALQGSGSYAEIVQSVNAHKSEALEILKQIRNAAEHIDDENQRLEVQESVATLAEEVQAEQPNAVRLRVVARGTWAVAHNVATIATLLRSLYDVLDLSGVIG